IYPSGETKLYDTLIEAVQNTFSQAGAKCVIAFTDGMDNRSVSTPEEVINYAKMYEIPIFIIGIGSSLDAGILSNIANETGGVYRDISYVDASLNDIYNEIYRKQKEVYCLEYQLDSDNMSDNQRIELYVHNEENGGKIDCNYRIDYDYFTILLQKFLSSYEKALEKGDYSIMENAGYLDKNGTIASQMKPYIIKNKEKLYEQLLSCEITDIQFIDKNTYEITTQEKYDIQQIKNYKKDKLYDLSVEDNKKIDTLLYSQGYWPEYFEDEDIWIHKCRVLEGHYKVVKKKEGFKMCDYTANFGILSSEVYTAYPSY
ncbi:MAG: VWA domain-containing protein, partial [Acetivibrio sp.]